VLIILALIILALFLVFNESFAETFLLCGFVLGAVVTVLMMMA